VNQYEQDFYNLTGIQFQVFYKKTKNAVRWHVSKVCYNYEESKLYVDKAFELFIQNLHLIDPTMNYFNYLVTTATNLVFQHNKRKRVLHTMELDDDTYSYLEDSVTQSTEECNIYQYDVVIKMIDALPVMYREPLTMQLIDHMSMIEISSVLNLNKNTVKSRLKKAKSMIVSKYNAYMIHQVAIGNE